MDWRPIQTAPLDGTGVILHLPETGVVYGSYDHIGTADWWVIRSGDKGWWSPYMKNEESPLCWMPMPATAPLGNVAPIKPISRNP